MNAIFARLSWQETLGFSNDGRLERVVRVFGSSWFRGSVREKTEEKPHTSRTNKQRGRTLTTSTLQDHAGTRRGGRPTNRTVISFSSCHLGAYRRRGGCFCVVSFRHGGTVTRTRRIASNLFRPSRTRDSTSFDAATTNVAHEERNRGDDRRIQSPKFGWGRERGDARREDLAADP